MHTTTILRVYKKDLKRFHVLRAHFEADGMERLNQPKAFEQMLTCIEIELAKKK